MSILARIRPRLRAREGQALVEFALVVPLILLLILGAVDFGRAYFYKNDVTSLANQAARFAEVNSCSACASGSSIEAYVKSTAVGELSSPSGGGQISSPGVTISFCFKQPVSNPPGQIGDALQATATATYNWLPFLGFAANVVIKSTVIVRIATAYDSVTAANDAYGNGTSGSTFPTPSCPP